MVDQSLNDLLTDMRRQVEYSDKITMSIPLYERMKAVIAVMGVSELSSSTDKTVGSATRKDAGAETPATHTLIQGTAFTEAMKAYASITPTNNFAMQKAIGAYLAALPCEIWLIPTLERWLKSLHSRDTTPPYKAVPVRTSFTYAEVPDWEIRQIIAKLKSSPVREISDETIFSGVFRYEQERAKWTGGIIPPSMYQSQKAAFIRFMREAITKIESGVS